MAGFLDFKLDVKGVAEMKDALASTVDEMHKAAQGALFTEATEIINKSKKIVPFRLGTLQASGQVYGQPVITGDRIEVVMGYGGAAAEYSIVQHETPPDIFKHLPGRTWKYLEGPFFAAAKGMAQRLAARIANRIGG